MPTEMISADCVIPAPMMSETDRQKRIERYRLGAWARGCIIEKEWRVHNPVFDKKDEKTTTMMRVRPAKTKDEVEFILTKLKFLAPNKARGGEVEAMEYQKCPICNGCGLMPGGFFDSCGFIDEYGNRTWTSDHVQETCRVCEGKGIIVAPPQEGSK